jgi:hypothetical protein
MEPTSEAVGAVNTSHKLVLPGLALSAKCHPLYFEKIVKVRKLPRASICKSICYLQARSANLTLAGAMRAELWIKAQGRCNHPVFLQ